MAVSLLKESKAFFPRRAAFAFMCVCVFFFFVKEAL